MGMGSLHLSCRLCFRTTRIIGFSSCSSPEDAVDVISVLLTKPFPSSSALTTALDATGLHPTPLLLETLLKNSPPRLSPKILLTVFQWARSHQGFSTTPSILASVVDILAKSRFFATAWSLVLNTRDRTETEVTTYASPQPYLTLIRRYGRAGMPAAAIRTYEFFATCSNENDDGEVFDGLIDSLCKEGYTRIASDYMAGREGKVASVRCYNILLNGWFRARKLDEAERLWVEMRSKGVRPTVVSYGTIIEGLCQMRRVDDAMKMIDEMRSKKGGEVEPNVIVLNPIVDALAEGKRFKEALGAVEKFPLYGISPNISTFNSLVKGFCKNGDIMEASAVLKMMIGRGIFPTATTYNYFFRFFSRCGGKIEEGLNLYNKMVKSGYSPDRLTYHLLIKMVCEEDRAGRGGGINLAVRLIRDMNAKGFDSDLATSTMLIHMLCRMNMWDEACVEFKEMIEKGLVPQYLTYQRLIKNLKRLGMIKLSNHLTGLMNCLYHSNKLPANYKHGGSEEDKSLDVRKAIVYQAKTMSDILKHSRERQRKNSADSTQVQLKSRRQISVESANKLIAEIKNRGIQNVD
ncbi:Pentatricopeptide repeat-containing protein [Zostera marina]|uniref:Pentatricopeptide repeat-containing protein n=1 Tax=Zostera marina TaxID=29655 RepID=A0A0K9Q366_ZOSMR|nr:Pentatricopeptide repeat-containing protein [Zostera marina]